MGPEKAPWASPLSHSFAYEMLFVSEAAVYFHLGGYSCQLSPDYWSVRSKGRSQSYHKGRNTAIEVRGIFNILPPYPKTLPFEWKLPYMFLFGDLVGHLKIISTLRRKLLWFIQNFLNPNSCCALPFPRKVHCSISTPIKFKSRAALSGRAAAQIGRAVAILLQSRAESRTLTLACCSHALPSPGFPLTPWHPARHRIYLHNTTLETAICSAAMLTRLRKSKGVLSINWGWKKCFETRLIEFPAAAQFPFSQELLGQTREARAFHREQRLALTRCFHEDFNPGWVATSWKEANSSPASHSGFRRAGWSGTRFPTPLPSGQGQGQRGSRKEAGRALCQRHRPSPRRAPRHCGPAWLHLLRSAPRFSLKSIAMWRAVYNVAQV